MATSLQVALLSATVAGALLLAGLLVLAERHRVARRRERALDRALGIAVAGGPAVDRVEPIDWLPALSMGAVGVAFVLMVGSGACLGLPFGLFFLAAAWVARPVAMARRRRRSASYARSP